MRKEEYLVPQKKGGGFRFIHLALEATIEDLKKKAIEVFFPDSMNHFGEKADECTLTFTDAGDNIVTTEISIKDYLHKKGLYLSRTYFVMHSRYRGLLDLDLLNSFEREDFESDIVWHQPTNLGLGSTKNVVSRSQGEFKDQCNRLVLSNDINFNFCKHFDGDVQRPVSQAVQSRSSGIQNSAKPTKNENIDI